MPRRSLRVLAISLFLFYTKSVQADNIILLPDYSFKYSAETSASTQDIWKLWSDVQNWKQFDERIEYSSLDDGQIFTSGARGYLKGKNAPRTAFELVDVKSGISFTQRLKLPFYQFIELRRYFEKDTNGKTVFTHEVNFKGRLRALTYAMLSSPFKKDLKLVVNQIRLIAERR